MDVLETIEERRSIRRYKDKDLEEEKVRMVIQAAVMAPSWANTQCWKFVVVKDNDLKKKLSDTLTESNPAKDSMEQAPVILVGCAERGISGFSDGKPFDEKEWDMFDMGLAMQNLMLAAKSLGMGTVPIGAFDSDKVSDILGIPEDLRVIIMTPLGYPATDSESSRKELDHFIIENKF